MRYSFSCKNTICQSAYRRLYCIVVIHPCDRDYPSFYTRLYAFLDQDLLHLKYRSRFFRLAELFLSSTSVATILGIDPKYLIR